MHTELSPEVVRYFEQPIPRGRPPHSLAKLSRANWITYYVAVGALLGALATITIASAPTPEILLELLSVLAVFGVPFVVLGWAIRRRNHALFRKGRLVEAIVVERAATIIHYRRPVPGQKLVFAEPQGRQFQIAIADYEIRNKRLSLPETGEQVMLILADNQQLTVVLLAGEPRLVCPA